MSGVVGASTLRSGSPATAAPLVAAAVAAAPTLAALLCRVVTRGVRGGIEDPSHTKIVQGGDTCPLNPISSQSLTVLFIYLFTSTRVCTREPPYSHSAGSRRANRTVRDLAPQKKS